MQSNQKPNLPPPAKLEPFSESDKRLLFRAIELNIRQLAQISKEEHIQNDALDLIVQLEKRIQGK
jgi:hypothetical protein